MLAPLSWLKDYVDIDCSPEELEKKLFDCGFEVEEILKYGDKTDKIVVCQIKEIKQHPNAERLRICQVDAGKYGNLQIITNATNVSEGDYVPVAVDGATLFNGEKIKNGNLRGEPSYGMFCGGEEIGITEDFYEGAGNNSVLIFKEKYPLGEEVKNVLGLTDYVFDISVLANRPDCQSILGIAREIAAILKKPLKEPAYDYTVTGKTDDRISVTVEAKDLCPRYIAHYVSDVKIGESPRYIKKRLALCGINSINNIVDITNYVLLEMGQPMHAFDMADLNGRKIIVRRANNGEHIVALNEKDLTLSENNLVICDENKPVALAGIMGGLNSGIKDTTSEILFECAKFKRDNIRKSSRTLGINSDSSHRFEKGVDEYTTELAMKRALHLICELQAGKVGSTHIDVSAGASQENKEVSTTIDKINGVLGIKVPAENIIEILKRLNFKVESDGNYIKTTAPAYREDVESYPDLAEEVIRMYGYEHITPSLLKYSVVTAGGYTADQLAELKTKKAMAEQGFNEIMTYSFYSDNDLAKLNLPDGADEKKVIRLENPISDNYEIMRRTFVPSILNVVSYNLKKFNDEARMFELAKIYIPKSLPISDFPTERKTFCFAMYGENEDFFTAKGVLKVLEDNFGVKFNLNERAEKSFLHPGVSAKIILSGKEIGYFGQVAYDVAEKFDIEKKVYIGEFDYEALQKEIVSTVKFKPVSGFDDITRDLALTADEKISNAEIEEIIKSACKQNVSEIKLFDVYRGEQVGENKKSMAYTITFTDDTKQLTAEDAETYVKKILGALKHRLDIDIR